MELTLDALGDLVARGGTLSSTVEYSADGAVAPATYAGPHGEAVHATAMANLDGSIVPTVVLSSGPAEANAMEQAWVDLDLGLPVLAVAFGDGTVVTSLDAPQRAHDGYVVLAEADGTPWPLTEQGRALYLADQRNPLALVEHSPHSLLLGFDGRTVLAATKSMKGVDRAWLFEAGRKKVPHVVGGSIEGIRPTEAARRRSTRRDVLANDVVKTEKLSESGLGSIPSDAIGTVAVERIVGRSTLSLPGLRRIAVRDDAVRTAALQTMLASLAVVGIRALAEPRFLRAGCTLDPVGPASWECRGIGSIDEPSLDQAVDLWRAAVKAAGEVGLPVDHWATMHLSAGPALEKALTATIAKGEAS